MRALHRTFASIGLVAVISGTTIVACFAPAEDCDLTKSCNGGAVTGTGGSGGGSAPDACEPGPGTDTVAAECGIFVSSSAGNDVNDGSPEAPLKTFAAAIAMAQTGMGRVYACAEEFSDPTTVPGGVAIYGGLDCAGGSWRYIGDATKTTIKPAADMVALTVSGGSGNTHIADVAAVAADATIPGGSSIASVVDGISTEFVRCDFTAGAGVDGENGAPLDAVMPSDSNDPAIRGNMGVNACSNGTVDTAGGDAKTNDGCSASVGGKGGSGLVATGANGEDGQLLPDPNPGGFGLGGVGADQFPCKSGENGLPGGEGAAGAGAMTLGTLSATGIAGAAGTDGTPGAPGQGGGGGGGAKGKVNCAGASGGSGGAGGCGGAGGKGGQAGGSSIALISVAASLSLTDVTVTAAAGGKGGNGGDGQFGGVGGAGGTGGIQVTGTQKGCTGGEGGSGGSGGQGGGGRGGHSIGIAFTGSGPSAGFTAKTGTPGAGGTGFDAAGSGMPGVQSDMQQF